MDTIYLTPIIGALIGYFTNWLAIKMVFRPYEAKYIFGIKVPFTPGLIAVERPRITEQIGFVISNYLLTQDDISESVSNIDFNESTKKMVLELTSMVKSSDKTIDDLLKSTFKENYDAKRLEIIQGLNNSLNNSLYTKKSDEKIFRKEQNIKKGLPTVLNVVKKTLEEDLYSVDEISISLLDDVMSSAFGSFGPLVSGLLNSQKIYDAIKGKILFKIENNYDEIEEKLIGFVKANNKDTEILFDLNQLVELAVDNILSIKVSDIGKYLDVINNDEIIKVIANEISKFVSSESSNLLKDVDVSKLVTKKLDEMPLSEIENLIMVIAKKEIKSITYVGGVLGLIIGFLPLIFK